MATRVVPATLDADNPAGSHTLAACNDWRSTVRKFLAGTGPHEPTPDAGYATAGSARLPQRPISLFLSGGSPYSGLALDPPHLTGVNLGKHLQELRNQWLEIDQPTGSRAQYHDGEGKIIDALLKREIAIHRDEDIKLSGGSGEQRAIAHTRPSQTNDRSDVVPRDLSLQPSINTLVKQQSHGVTSIRRSFASSRNETTCSRATLGKPSRKSSIDSPPSR